MTTKPAATSNAECLLSHGAGGRSKRFSRPGHAGSRGQGTDAAPKTTEEQKDDDQARPPQAPDDAVGKPSDSRSGANTHDATIAEKTAKTIQRAASRTRSLVNQRSNRKLPEIALERDALPLGTGEDVLSEHFAVARKQSGEIDSLSQAQRRCHAGSGGRPARARRLY